MNTGVVWSTPLLDCTGALHWVAGAGRWSAPRPRRAPTQCGGNCRAQRTVGPASMQAGDQQGEQGEQGEHGGQGEQEEPGEHGRIGEHGEPVAHVEHVEHGEQGELEEKKEYREHGEQGVALNDAEETEIRDIDVNDDEPAEIPVIVPDITASNENIDDGSIQDIVDATFKETGEADDDDDEEKLLEDCSADQGEAAAGQGDEQPQASVGSEDKSAGPEQSLAANSKKTSAVLERKESDGSSFWSLSARNSVVSMFDPGQEVTDEQDGGEAETLLQSPRKMLQKKRSSLSHKPDIVRVFEKKSLQDQETDNVHEFQKVKIILIGKNFKMFLLAMYLLHKHILWTGGVVFG